MTEIKRITLFKIKQDTNFDDYLKGDIAGYDRVIGEGFEAYIRFDIGGGAEKSEEQVPWLRFLNSGFEEKQYKFKAINRFPRAIMAVRFTVNETDVRHYVATFGQHADSFLDKSLIVHDFGIRVGMNICDTDRLRRVQTMVHESISRQTERQASIGANLRVFGIDTDAEFLRTISGFVKPAFTEIVESFRGRDSISIKIPRNRRIGWEDLVSICRRLDERYYSTEYRDTEFKVYDILRHESDPTVVSKLDASLCSKIANREFSKIHLAPPEFLESECLDFAYIKASGGIVPQLYEDLRIEDLVDTPRRRLKGLTAATLKNWPIYEFDSQSNTTFYRWNAYQCMVAEIDLEDRTYVLANGQWREISPELKIKVSEYFRTNDLHIEANHLPENTNIFDPQRNQNREEVYNREVTRNNPDIFLFDKSKVKIAGQGLYEICDLFHTDRQFIHVKRYTSGASSISHIFTQTKMYSHAFSTDAETRRSIGEWIDVSDEPENANKNRETFKNLISADARINEHDYTVIFCLLHDREEFTIGNLPFMSQYELMLTHRFLTEDRRFNVGVVFRRVELGAHA
ncbi:hypothetical protein BR10RB9215_C20110 [Brucella sp. 10RB9215]|uniref:DUF6119 family protein n=1 Tax=Brucella sp. 10RB9215 TaxID=1149953 RepID=UPI00090A54B2|nr:DUF6119 family protein [Brucella sp. 10RB9215]SBW15449.1 hypothetical protein BR10RB9215_C20110 [Brucella sp. 10RB9215]